MKPHSHQEVSELLLLRLASPQWSVPLERGLRQLAPGGVLLSSPLPRSPGEVHSLLSKIATCLPSAPILAIEEDGGAEGPLSALLPPLPCPRILGEKGADHTRQAGELVGEALKLLGFNTNLAPSLDVDPGSPREASPTCAFGADPGTVTECGQAFSNGLARHGITACGKRFPGMGGVQPSSGGELDVSAKSMAGLWTCDLIPYRQLLSKLPAVMLSTAAYKAYDFYTPCSAVLSSQVVQGLLRAKLGYRGVVIAPGLECPKVRGGMDLGVAAAQSIAAGCDMLVAEDLESAQTMRQGIASARGSGQLKPERVALACAGIHSLKSGLKLPHSQLSTVAWDRLIRRLEGFSTGH